MTVEDAINEKRLQALERTVDIQTKMLQFVYIHLHMDDP